MLLSTLLLGALLAAGQRSATDTATLAPTAGSVDTAIARPALTAPPATDTVRRRPRAVEVSDAYEMRLRIHRYASYTMIPLFVVQSVAGNQLYLSGGPSPGWANTLHKAGAAGLGAVFTVNTVTGLWNLWESRDNEVGRTKRWLHSGLMLASDAGFTYAGIKLASDAKRTQEGRDRHRRVAYISMGGALAGYAVMLIGNH